MRIRPLFAILLATIPVFSPAQQFPYGTPPPMTGNTTVGFQPIGKTSILAASTTSASVALSVVTSANAPQIQIYNGTAGIAYVVFCAQGVTCTASAGSSGTATADYPIAPGAVIVMTPPAGTGVAAAVLSSTSGIVEFTPGVGL